MGTVTTRPGGGGARAAWARWRAGVLATVHGIAWLVGGPRGEAQTKGAAAQLLPAIPLGTSLEAKAAGGGPEASEASEALTLVQSGAVPGAGKGMKASPEDARLQRLLKTTFDRRPAGMLKALASRDVGGGVAGETNEAVRLKRLVETGDWPGLGELLRGLATNQVSPVFLHVARGMQRAGGTGLLAVSTLRVEGEGEGEGEVVAEEVPEGLLAQQGAGRGEAYVVPADVLGLASARPGVLLEPEVQALGTLLTMATAKGNSSVEFMASLEAGVGSLGGKDREGRLRAARLLFSAGRAAEAGRFLPALADLRGTNDLPLLAMHAQSLAGARDGKGREAALRRAWEVNLDIVRAKGARLEARREALVRMLELWPMAKADLGPTWLAEAFGRDGAEGLLALATMAEVLARDAGGRDVERRASNLTMQRDMARAVLEAAPDASGAWRPALNLMAAGWLQEAELSKARHRPKQRPGRQFDEFGNPIFMGGGQDMQMFQQPGQLPALDVERVRESRPEARWLGVLDASVLPRAHALMAELELCADDLEGTMREIGVLAQIDRERATRVANDWMVAWARIHDPNPPVRNMMPRYFYPGMQVPTGIPLTRSLQARNLGDLAGALARLRGMSLALRDDVVVNAFTTAHGTAEVFRQEDIERVFGPVDEMSPGTLAGLMQTMRERLAGPWRQARLQQEAKTRRTDRELEAEVVRGYEVLTGMIQRAVEARPDDWRLQMVRGATLFDRAEFDYGRKVDLKVYTTERDAAFRSMASAVAMYAARVASMEEGERTASGFLQWFNATLGASDLAYLTRQQEPDTNHLSRVRAALHGLPSSVRDAHVAEFGRAVASGMDGIKPELKPRYLRAGLQVVGEHASVAEVRKVVRHYDDLLEEVVLDVRLDGPAEVGHGAPFGVHVALRYTEAIGRESGHFAKYLQNQQKFQNFYNPYGTPPVNYRDDFEKHLRATWDRGFEVVSVTFHDERVEPRGFGRAGWRETPYAYVLLKARDAAVDRLPSLRMDLDFVDRHGPVILPVTSQAQMVDARPVKGAPGLMAGVECVQVLDDREAGQGKLGLEIKATGLGLLPELEELLDLSLPGYRVERKPGTGLSLLRVEAGGDAVKPVTERTLVLSLTAEPGGEAPRAFRFPAARREGVTNVFKRYADADLELVKAEVPVAGMKTASGMGWWGWTVGGMVAVVLGAGLWGLRRRTEPETVAAPRHPLPDACTPFTTLRYLQRIQGDESMTWTPERRRALDVEIRDLEARYFGRGPAADVAGASTSGGGDPDLVVVARRWATWAE